MAEDVNRVENNEISAGKYLDDVKDVDDEEGFKNLWFGERLPRSFATGHGFFFTSMD